MIKGTDTSIVRIDVRQVYSERKNPGLEAYVYAANGAHACALCTPGVSVGTHEVKFTYDGGTKFNGKGVLKAIEEAKQIAIPKLIGMDCTDQKTIDTTLIQLRDQGTVGGNVTAALSAAIMKTGAEALGIPLYRHIGGENACTLPVPGTMLLAGRRRYLAGDTTNKPSYALLAYDFDTFSDASYALWEVNRLWTDALMKKFDVMAARDGFSDLYRGAVKSDKEIWDVIADCIVKSGYEGKVGMQADLGADSYYDRTTGLYSGLCDESSRTRDQQIQFVLDIVRDYPFVCLEDPLYEDDYEGHAIITKNTDIQIVGDDLYTTNKVRVEKGLEFNSTNAVLMKVNQIGTMTESLAMVDFAYSHDLGVMPCQSRGEGVTLCDYCVGINAGSVRECGLHQYGNRFMEIEAELGTKAKFAGKKGLKGSRFQK